MVSYTNVSRYEGDPPTEGEERRIETSAPLYAAPEIEGILGNPECNIVSWTKDAAKDAKRLDFDGTELRDLLQEAISRGRYRGAVWCIQRPEGPWAACDEYELTRIEQAPASASSIQCHYYVKFAIARTGQAILLVSCHLSA